LSTKNNDPMVQEIAQKMHGIKISVKKSTIKLMNQRAFVLDIQDELAQSVEMPHITIAYFKESITEEQFNILLEIMFDDNSTNVSKFIAQQQQAISRDASNSKKQFSGRPQDWWCETCKFKVFGSKPKCFKCGAKRP
jgi:hypothetical protein